MPDYNEFHQVLQSLIDDSLFGSISSHRMETLVKLFDIIATGRIFLGTHQMYAHGGKQGFEDEGNIFPFCLGKMGSE